jgi:hypothetical protein
MRVLARNVNLALQALLPVQRESEQLLTCLADTQVGVIPSDIDNTTRNLGEPLTARPV